MRRILSLLAILTIGAGSLGLAEPVRRTQTRWLTTDKLRQELAKPFSAKLEQAELRQITSTISETRQVSVLLDRRLDPSRQHQLDLSDVALNDALRQIAGLANANVSVLENAVYLGPQPATRSLRTLIELRTNDLQLASVGIPERRRKELLRRRDIDWSDLDTPREILTSITKPLHLEIQNTDLIPHDLWAAGSLPNATVVQALSLVLVQFDLTFRWLSAGNAIELLPIPEKVTVRRNVRPRLSVIAAMDELQQQFPEATINAAESELVVFGTVEEHEAISKWITGSPATRPIKKQSLKDIKQRRFTFSVPQPVPLIVVMKKLEESEIEFEYDAQELATAGINLEQLIDVNVVDASAEAFFKKLFESAKLDFQIDRKIVRLKPKSKPADPAKN